MSIIIALPAFFFLVYEMRKAPGEETQIRKSILDWLLAQPFVDIAFQNDRVSVKRRRLINKYRPAGFPDIGGNFTNGIAFYIEVKRPKQKMSEAQEDFIAARRRTEAVAFCADSLGAAIQQMKSEGYY